MTRPPFRSVLAGALRDVVEHRHALGYSDRVLVTRLAHFDRYLVARRWRRAVLTRDVVEDWVALGGPIKPHTRAERMHVMRLLGRFLALTQPDTYVPGPAYASQRDTGFRPHIYTPDQLTALFKAAARLGPPGSLRPRTVVTLLGLLCCTGLRISEALALQLDDVDLGESVLWIREAKFHKGRAVPVGQDVSTALARYLKRRAAYGHEQAGDAPLFVSEHRRGCTYSVVCRTFLKLARSSKLRGPPGTSGPRIHDIRHTFAVARLLAWYRDGGDVQARLPLLADYLGHVSLVSTQVYLEITAELLAEGARRFLPPRGAW